MRVDVFVPALIMVAAVAGAVAFIGGGLSAESYMQRQAVEYGCASYDTQTGKWGWK